MNDEPDQYCFRNVDLEIRSRSKLDALKEEWRDEVITLHSGMEGGTYLLNVELTMMRFKKNFSPDSCIRAFSKLVEKLPPAGRRVWDRATKKSFDVGWDISGVRQWSSSFAIKPETLRRVAGLGATLSVTVYHHRNTRTKTD